MLVVTRRIGEPVIIGLEEQWRLIVTRITKTRVTLRVERWISLVDVLMERYPADESDNSSASNQLYQRLKRLEVEQPDQTRPFLKALLFQATQQGWSGKYVRKRLSDWLALPLSSRMVAAKELCRHLREEEAEED